MGDQAERFRASASNDVRHVTLQLREDTARRNKMNARTSLRTCEDHSCTMNTLVNADGVPPDFINGADAKEAAALAQQPWYCVLYVAQVQMRPHRHIVFHLDSPPESVLALLCM